MRVDWLATSCIRYRLSRRRGVERLVNRTDGDLQDAGHFAAGESVVVGGHGYALRRRLARELWSFFVLRPAFWASFCWFWSVLASVIPALASLVPP
jgi:hypothetical protein